MASISLTESSVTAVKNSLRDEFPDASSSHISEALAYSLGFNTHAALRVALACPEADAPYAFLKSSRMLERLQQFGYPDDPDFTFEWMMDRTPQIISTVPSAALEINYKAPRQKAWRNLMVCAVNAALDQKLFTLRAGDNRFEDHMRSGTLFEFQLPNGMPARGFVSDAGFDELAVHAAVNPRGTWVRTFDGGFHAGDVFGTTWLERRDGAWLQTCMTNFRCRRAMLPILAQLDVEPAGFGDRGAVLM